MTEPVPRFQVVPSRPRLSTRHWIVGIALAWLLSLLLVGWLVRGYADPGHPCQQDPNYEKMRFGHPGHSR